MFLEVFIEPYLFFVVPIFLQYMIIIQPKLSFSFFRQYSLFLNISFFCPLQY